jgi:hypothetical protein
VRCWELALVTMACATISTAACRRFTSPNPRFPPADANDDLPSPMLLVHGLRTNDGGNAQHGDGCRVVARPLPVAETWARGTQRVNHLPRT